MASRKTELKTELKTVIDIYKYLHIYLPNRRHFTDLFNLFIKTGQINRIKEFKVKGYSRVLQQYLFWGPKFLKFTMNALEGPTSVKNIENIFDHTISYVKQKLAERRPFEKLNFVVLKQDTTLTNALTNLSYLYTNGCKEENRDDYTYITNNCTKISNNIDNDEYTNLDKTYYRIYKNERTKEGFLKRKIFFKKENPSVYYNTLYSSFEINDIKIGHTVINENGPDSLIHIDVIGVGYQMYYDKLKIILLSLDDDCETCGKYIVDLDELFILGYHHPIENYTNVIDPEDKKRIVNVIGPNKPKYLKCRDKKYSTKKQEKIRKILCIKEKSFR